MLRLFPVFLFMACAGSPANLVQGSYRGSIVASTVINPVYIINITAEKRDLVVVSGAEFEPFEVELQQINNTVTNMPGSASFNWSEEKLEIAGEIQFSGVPAIEDN